MSEARATTNHDEIRKWVEARGGRPSRVAETAGGGSAGVLRIDFGEPEERLEEIPWEDFFETFEKSHLAFLHQDKTADGHTSRFFKLIRRDGD